MGATKGSRGFLYSRVKCQRWLPVRGVGCPPGVNDQKHGECISRVALHMQPVTSDGVPGCLPDR